MEVERHTSTSIPAYFAEWLALASKPCVFSVEKSIWGAMGRQEIQEG
jgi:hypothetical protein